jgi:hypothetical protein
MNFAETARYHADMFETFFLKIFYEESQNALMIGSDIKEILPVLVLLICLKLVNDLFCYGVKAHEADVIDVFATL